VSDAEVSRWRRDYTWRELFPRYWKFAPPVLIASALVGLVFAIIWAPLGGLGVTIWGGALVALWGPRGLMRPTRDTRRAVLNGTIVCLVLTAIWFIDLGRAGLL
jgi:hypothetical protein